MAISTDVVNQALLLIGGDMPPVTGAAPNFDSSTAGKAAASLYAPCVATIARQNNWDFTRKTALLTTTGNTPPSNWAFEYAYPAGSIQVWALHPTVISDPNNPLPLNWTVATAVVGGVPVRVIHSNDANVQAVFNSNPPETAWDSLFREAVVRLLASEMAMAIAGKPDVAMSLVEGANAFSNIGGEKDS